MDAIDPAMAPSSGIVREDPTIGDSRKALVQRWQKDVEQAKSHWSKDFRRMRRNMSFASGKQWQNQAEEDDRYKANLVQRVLKQAVASMYAKNPRVVAKRREKMDFVLWDGRPETAQMAMQAMMAPAAMVGPDGQQAVDPAAMNTAMQAQALMADIQQGVERRQMIDKIGKTLELLVAYYIDEQQPRFKTQMKQLVRRIRTAGVGYIKLDFQRQMDLSDDQTTKIADMTERLATIGQLQADLQDGEHDPYCAEAEELRLAMQQIQAEPEMIVREGLLWMFPQATRIIPSPETRELMGWVGAPWIAEEILLPVDEVKKVYGVDLGKNYTGYKVQAGKPWSAARLKDGEGKGLACVWHVYDRNTGLEYVVADGYPDFLREPAAPNIQVEQFFPIWAITFNAIEDECRLFPDSDVENLVHIQREYNRAKEAKRQHRIANRPLYLAPEGQFDEDEQKSLASHEAHSVIMVKAMRDGVKPTDLIGPVAKIGVDPNLYETEEIFADAVRVVGIQEAMIGGTANGTATEASVAQGSFNNATGLDSDDFDDVLTEVMKAAGQVLLTELDEETVKAIVGPGAVWPQFSRSEIMAETWLEVKAGSTGRPNQQEQAAKLERMTPLLIQVPGVNPRWLAEKAVQIADDDVDLTEAVIEGLPAITAMSAMQQPGTGNPETDPNAQGDKGRDNERKPEESGGTGQPQFNSGPEPNQMMQ